MKNTFDNSLDYGIPEINNIETELKSIGYKKFKCGSGLYKFRNDKYSDTTIEKSVYICDETGKKTIGYRISEEYETIMEIVSLGNTKITDKRDEVYKKYFNGEVRKKKIEKLLENGK